MRVSPCSTRPAVPPREPCVANCSANPRIGSSDSYSASERTHLEQTIREIRGEILERSERLEEAKRHRRVARRLCVVMSIATVATSVGVLFLTVPPWGFLSPALWVVPSALGGSAVAQASAALRARSDILALRRQIVCLDVALGALEAQRRCRAMLSPHESP